MRRCREEIARSHPRLYPEDIVRLYPIVPVGTQVVVVVREPVKVALTDDRVYVEVHADADLKPDYAGLARQLLGERGLADRVDAAKLEAALRKRNGIPVDVTRQDAVALDERTSYLR